MKYKKKVIFLDGITNQLFKFRTKIWFEINDESWGEYNNSSIKFRTSMITSDLRNYSDGYILFSGTITITGGDDNANRTDKKIKE